MANQFVTDLPELRSLSREKITALVGVAPVNRDSGTMRGKRAIFGGWTAFRSTLSAMQPNAAITDFAGCLKADRKPFKVRTIACVRKLPTILNVIVWDQQPWRNTCHFIPNG